MTLKILTDTLESLSHSGNKDPLCGAAPHLPLKRGETFIPRSLLPSKATQPVLILATEHTLPDCR